MAVFRIEKNKGYTVMSNYHLKDKTLSLKSKGLLSLIFSLPDEWNYTTRGLAAICKEGVDCIGAILRELETAGYLERHRMRGEKGRLTDTEYRIYEFPQVKQAEVQDETLNESQNNTLEPISQDAAIPSSSAAASITPDLPVSNPFLQQTNTPVSAANSTSAPDTGNPLLDAPRFNKPRTEKPYMDSSYTDLPHTEMPAQLITNISKELKNQVTDVSNINQSINQRPDASALPYTTPDVTAIDGIDSMEPIEIYRSIIRENIEYDSLCERNEYSVDEIKEIVELILETICSSRKVIRIGGEDKPAEYVKSRLLKLEAEHIEYVLDCMGKNTTDVRNIKSYMLTALFNAPATIGNYYRSLVNHDMYGKKGRC